MILSKSAAAARVHPRLLASLAAIVLCPALTACGKIAPEETTSLPIPPAAGPIVDLACKVTSGSLHVLSFADQGPIARPASIASVGGGGTVRLGASILWSFAEATLTTAADSPLGGGDGDALRSSIGGESSLDAPFAPVYPQDSAGAPLELIPLDASERTFNATHGPDESLVLWPMGGFTASDGAALLFYEKIDVKPGFLNLAAVSVGIARMAPGDSAATRDPEPLFVAPEPQFGSGVLIDQGNVYVYGCSGGYAPDGGCRVARAPLEAARTRGSYAVWNGSSWSSDLTSGAVVFDWVPGGASVVWHPHLNQFVAIYVTPFGTEAVMRTAPRPEGPWSAATPLLTDGSLPMQSATEQGVLASDCGRTTILTFIPALPADAGPGTNGVPHALELHLE